MKRKQIVVTETRNGWLVVDGDGMGLHLGDVSRLSWSFNSLDAAIAQIRRILKAWRAAAENESAKAEEGE